MIFEAELKKAGLTDKEAAVYVAALELGPSPVQPIARRAKVARGTTYIVLEKLLRTGLITRYTKGKRTMFVAEPPKQLLRLIEKQQETLEKYSHDLEELLPKLYALTRQRGKRPLVRYYEGVEGLAAIRREMVMYSGPGDIWYNLTPVDYLKSVFGDELYVYSRHRIAKGITSKTIFTTTSEQEHHQLLTQEKQHRAIRRFVPPDRYTSSSGFTIYRDRVAIGSFNDEIGGVVIESDSVATMMRQFFDLTWDNLATE